MSRQEVIPQPVSEVVKKDKKSHTVSQLGMRAVSSVISHSPERIRRGVEDIAIRKILGSKRYDVKVLSDDSDIQLALDLEQEVWYQEGFGKLDVYDKYLPQSRMFAAFDGEKCVGVNRLFAGTPKLPPFIEAMPIDDPSLRESLIIGSHNQTVEEYGTAAVERDLRSGRIFLDLCRVAYRDATERGIEHWGIIMEPTRVEKMNRFLGFTFKQVGPEIDYQGGDCAAHIMSFPEVRQHMQSTRPKLYDWFVDQPLDNS